MSSKSERARRGGRFAVPAAIATLALTATAALPLFSPVTAAAREPNDCRPVGLLPDDPLGIGCETEPSIVEARIDVPTTTVEPAEPAAAPQEAPIDIPTAKMEAANAYDRFTNGTGEALEYYAAETRLAKLTGEFIPSPYPDPMTGLTPRARLERDFVTLRQITGYYCGPAAVQSILWFLGPHTSHALDEWTGTQPSLSGNPHADQPLLANPFWLATEKYGGTPWGDYYVPFAINTWRGTSWYQLDATPNTGGDLTKDQAWRNIQYNLDHGFPVAVNVLYSPETVFPTGFPPVMSYQHWDTIFGSYTGDDGRQYVRIGEVYGAPGAEYDPYQDIAWDDLWPAIGEWFGIVW